MEYLKEDELNDFIELLISVLIWFPEVEKISFDRDREIVHLFFLLKDVKYSEYTEEKLIHIDSAIRCYQRLNKTLSYHYVTSKNQNCGNVLLDVERDLKTLTQNEINFIIDLFRMEFINHIMVEKTEESAEEDYRYFYEDSKSFINYRQELRLDRRKIGNNIVVCRESGKVLVFSN